MSFVRPELALAFRRWRAPILWGAAALIGLWLVWTGWQGRPVALGAGLLLTATALGLLVEALRRQRFRGKPPAQGIVSVSEARIGYFAPFGGGFIDIDALVRVDLVVGRGSAAWSLIAEGGTGLMIPLGARDADAIPDALARLPGVDLAAARAALSGGEPRRVPIWERRQDATCARLP